MTLMLGSRMRLGFSKCYIITCQEHSTPNDTKKLQKEGIDSILAAQPTTIHTNINHISYTRHFKTSITIHKAQHYIMRNILLTTTRAQHSIYESIMPKFYLSTCCIYFPKVPPYQNVKDNSNKPNNKISSSNVLLHCKTIQKCTFFKTSPKSKKLQFLVIILTLIIK